VIKIGSRKLWVILLCLLPLCGFAHKNNVVRVSPLRDHGVLSFTAPLQIPLHVTSGFGQRFHPVTAHYARHEGTDFAAPTYSKVLAIQEGVIIKKGSDAISGRYIVVRHKNGWQSKYLHLSVFDVQLHQAVAKGEVIALSGASGRTTGPHLHLEISYQGQAIDPALMLFSPLRGAPPSSAQKVKPLPPVRETDLHQRPRILFIVQRDGKTKVGVRKGKKLIYAQPGDKVFNQFKVVENGKRYSLQQLSG